MVFVVVLLFVFSLFVVFSVVDNLLVSLDVVFLVFMVSFLEDFSYIEGLS